MSTHGKQDVEYRDVALGVFFREYDVAVFQMVGTHFFDDAFIVLIPEFSSAFWMAVILGIAGIGGSGSNLIYI